MTSKSMPERIWAYEDDGFTDFISMKGWKENGISSPFEGDEYIRADLVPAQGSADEPLADGQYRWVHVEGEWHVAFVWKKIMSDGFAFELGKFDYWEEDIKKIGPVVRPPANNAN